MNPTVIFGIHKFLHNFSPGAEYIFSTNDPNNKMFKLGIMKTASSYRYMLHENVTFVEQPKKNSFYGKLAAGGRHITWGYLGSNPKPILKLIDDVLYVRGKKWENGPVNLKS